MSYSDNHRPPPAFKGFKLGSDLSGAQEAVPVPLVMGQRLVTVTWISRAYNGNAVVAQRSEKKDNNPTAGIVGSLGAGPEMTFLIHALLSDAYKPTKFYNFRYSIAGIACEGSVDYLYSIIIDGHAMWPRRRDILTDATNPQVRKWKEGRDYEAGDLERFGYAVYQCVLGHTSNESNAPPNPTYWTVYKLSRGSEDYVEIRLPTRGKMRLYWGTQTQTVDPILQPWVRGLNPNGNRKNELHPNYRGWCYIALPDFNFGLQKEAAPTIQLVLGRKPYQSIVTGDAAALDDGQANPISTGLELLTSDNCLQLSSARIDSTSAQATADAAQARIDLTGISELIDSQQQLPEIWQRIAAVCDGYMRWNASTKKIEFGLYAHGSAPASYTTLTIHDFADGGPPEFDAQGWRNAFTRAVVRFKDRARAFKDTSDKVSDGRAHAIVGEHRTLALDRSNITRHEQALAHAAETLKAIGRPQATSTISLRRAVGKPIRPGDYIRYDIDLEPGGDQLLAYFRVKQRTIPPRGAIEFQVEMDENLTTLAIAAVSEVNDPADEVIEIPNARIIPCPPKLAGNIDTLCILAERQSSVTAFSAWFDTNASGDFQKLANFSAFAQRAKLRDDHTSGQTTLKLFVPDQADTDLFSEQPGALAAADDQLLAILVEKKPSALMDDDAGAMHDDEDPNGPIATDELVAQIVEDELGFARFEVCSVSASDVVAIADDDGGAAMQDDDGGQLAPDDLLFDLTVLRSRLGTKARAFTAANCEVWLIHRSDLPAVLHDQFTTLRTNAATGTAPNVGYFRLQPSSTTLGEKDLADCPSLDFLWPRCVQARPQLTITAPTAADVTVAAPYPASLSVTGTITDEDANLVGFRVSLKKSGDSAETLVDEQVFNPTGEKAFDYTLQISEPGTFYIYVRAWDSTGLHTEAVFTVTAGAGTGKCATPELWLLGKLLPAGVKVFGPIELRCNTPGATMTYVWLDVADNGDPLGSEGPYDYDPDDLTTWPQARIVQRISSQIIGYSTLSVYAHKTGLDDSSFNNYLISNRAIY